MDNTFLFCSPSELEHNRYFRFFETDSDGVVCYEHFRTLIKCAAFQPADSWIVVNGLRFPDLVLIRICKYKNWKIVILQHNSHVPEYVLLERLKKVWFGSLKYLCWLVFSFLMLTLMMFKQRGDEGRQFCYCFNREFALKVVKLTGPCVVEILSLPDMRIYGADTVKLSSRTLEFFFVDEPFEQTIGIQSPVVLEEALKFLPDNRSLYVKLHPRSDPRKYVNSGQQVVVIDYFPEAVEVLFTFNSNLGKFYQPMKERYVFNKSEKKFVRDISEVVSNKENGDYISECLVKLTTLR